MKYLLILPRVICKLWFILNFVITLIVLYPVFFILLSRIRWFPKAFSLMRAWAKWLCYVSGIFPVVTTEVDWSEIPSPCIFVSNHSSYLDILLSYVSIPRYFVFVGKQELNKVPLLRIFFMRMNILVDRKSTVNAHKAFKQAGERIDRGESVFLFPEGTISSNGELIAFKKGAFKLAIEKQVPIVPLVFPDNWKLLQSGGFFSANGRPGIARAIIKKSVKTTRMSDLDLLRLLSEVKSSIQETLFASK